MPKFTLISFSTCPYVQRAIIALKEKQVDFDVIYIDLANKPDWFLAISPLGKVPVLKIEREGQPDAILFESSVILEYLDESAPGDRLHPADPLEKAQHRAWMEFGSALLGDLYRFTRSANPDEFEGARAAVRAKLQRLETVVAGVFFEGTRFSAVDAVFGPVFRQIDVVDTVAPTGLLDGLPRIATWARALADRPSVKAAVPADFAERLLGDLRSKDAAVLKQAA